MKRTAIPPLFVLGLALTAAAQTQTTKSVQLPVLNPVPRTNDLPFSQPKIHYQQWYEGQQFGTKIKQPVRFIGLEFLGALPSGTSLDIEVTVANTSSTLSGSFAQNFVSNKLIVLPRTKIPATGSTTQIAFKNHWKYDGQSHVVVDIKIFDNGTGKKIVFAATSTISTLSNVKQQYYIGDPNATTANSPGSTGHYGLTTKFLYQEGGTYDFGTGCPGGQNVTPVGSANAVPLPGLGTYQQLLTQAGSGYPCVFVMGISNTTWNGATLPLALNFLGAPNCSLLASGEFLAFTTTVGGGPGTGTAKLLTPIPGIGNLGGVKVYSQWLVLDKAAQNGNLSATKGLMHVVGS